MLPYIGGKVFMTVGKGGSRICSEVRYWSSCFDFSRKDKEKILNIKNTSRSSVSTLSERWMRKARRRAGLHQKGCAMMACMLGRFAGCAANMAPVIS